MNLTKSKQQLVTPAFFDADIAEVDEITGDW
jgi:hypothetical protein